MSVCQGAGPARESTALDAVGLQAGACGQIRSCLLTVSVKPGRTVASLAVVQGLA